MRGVKTWVCVREWREKRAAMAAALLPLQQLQVQQLRAGSWESEMILLLHIYCNPFSIYLNNIDSPVDVGGFAEPRKILCQCAIPPLSNYQYTPGRKSPTVRDLILVMNTLQICKQVIKVAENKMGKMQHILGVNWFVHIVFDM